LERPQATFVPEKAASKKGGVTRVGAFGKGRERALKKDRRVKEPGKKRKDGASRRGGENVLRLTNH